MVHGCRNQAVNREHQFVVFHTFQHSGEEFEKNAGGEVWGVLEGIDRAQTVSKIF